MVKGFLFPVYPNPIGSRKKYCKSRLFDLLVPPIQICLAITDLFELMGF